MSFQLGVGIGIGIGIEPRHGATGHMGDKADVAEVDTDSDTDTDPESVLSAKPCAEHFPPRLSAIARVCPARLREAREVEEFP